jgi:two-component system, response regulator
MNTADHSFKIVLCADDDPDDRELLTIAINELEPSYKVLTALNGEDALEKLAELNSIGHSPCLVILDMNMPVMDGKKTLEIMKTHSHWYNLPVAIFTTSPREIYADIALKYDVHIITKPAKYASMMKEVSQLLTFCSD